MKEKLYRFMQGRYGSDQLNRFLMILVVLCFVLSLFGARVFYILGIALLAYAYFRMFSKNRYKRSAENSVYLRYEYKLKQKVASFTKNMKQRKTHHIYKSDVRNVVRPLSKKAESLSPAGRQLCLDISLSIRAI